MTNLSELVSEVTFLEHASVLLACITLIIGYKIIRVSISEVLRLVNAPTPEGERWTQEYQDELDNKVGNYSADGWQRTENGYKRVTDGANGPHIEYKWDNPEPMKWDDAR